MRQPKYRNNKIKTSEGTFDSKKEYLRWVELKEKEGKLLIQGLKRQVTYKLMQAIHNIKITEV